MTTAGGPTRGHGRPPGGAYAQGAPGAYSGTPAPPPDGTEHRWTSGAYPQPSTSPPGPFTPGRWAPHPYEARREYRSARGPALGVVVLLAVMMLLSLARAWAHADRASLVDDLRTGTLGFVDPGEFQDADALVGAATVAYLLGMLATAVVFIVWQHRHASNAEALRGRADGLGPGWAIGGWFIPLANVVLPGMQIFGASRPSDPRLPQEPGARRGDGSRIVVPWATLYAVAAVVFALGQIGYPDRDDVALGELDTVLSEAVTADRTMAAGCVLFALAAFVGAVMAQHLTSRQDRRFAVITGSAGPGRPAVPGAGWSAPTQQSPWAPQPSRWAPQAPPSWLPQSPPSGAPQAQPSWTQQSPPWPPPPPPGPPAPPPGPPGTWAPPPPGPAGPADASDGWAPPGQSR